MNQYYKQNIININGLYSILNEIDFYKKMNLKSNFIVTLRFAFQDEENFYLVQDYLEGGNLEMIMKTKKTFSESQTKFIVACLICGLEFLHKNGYIYNNLEPKNIWFSKNGYVKLSNFKLVQEAYKPNYENSFCIPGYSAPELVFRENYTINSDLFSLGMITHLLIKGKNPLSTSSIKDYKLQLQDEALFKKNVLLKNFEHVDSWSQSLFAMDLVNKCLNLNPVERPGFRKISELKKFLWLKGFDWDKLLKMQLNASYSPGITKMKNIKPNVYENSQNLKEYIEMLEVQKKFDPYYYEIEVDAKIDPNIDDENIEESSENGEEEEKELD